MNLSKLMFGVSCKKYFIANIFDVPLSDIVASKDKQTSFCFYFDMLCLLFDCCCERICTNISWINAQKYARKRLRLSWELQ